MKREASPEKSDWGEPAGLQTGPRHGPAGSDGMADEGRVPPGLSGSARDAALHIGEGQ